MTSFYYAEDRHLYAEQCKLADIAQQMGTPCYVYSRAAIEQAWNELNDAFANHPHTICYAVKANSNLAVLNVLARLGSGFDIVSGGELKRVMMAGGDPQKVVFSGVAKSEQEIEYALQVDIQSINIESSAELERVQKVAAKINKQAPIAIRVNPDVDPKTHPYISTGLQEAKFGIDTQTAVECYKLAATMPNIKIHGLACHIGSQITTQSPFDDALDCVIAVLNTLNENGITIEALDLGGGLGIDYQGETPPSAAQYVQSMLTMLQQHGINLPVSIEPGRYIVGNAGVLLTEVAYLKHNNKKSFAVVDAGMNDLLRPSLYQAFHDIVNVDSSQQGEEQVYDVVGPICESADVLGYDRKLTLAAGDLLAVKSAGAYSFSMASNYNSRPRPAEIMVDHDQVHIIKTRETLEDLTRGEALLP